MARSGRGEGGKGSGAEKGSQARRAEVLQRKGASVEGEGTGLVSGTRQTGDASGTNGAESGDNLCEEGGGRDVLIAEADSEEDGEDKWGSEVSVDEAE
jgi:hypothetical protein